MSVLVYVEIREGSFKSINAELVTAAKQLDAGDVNIAIVGDGLDEHVKTAQSFDVSKVYVVQNAALVTYSTEGYASALAAIIEASSPSIVLFGATSMGKDLSARIAARCGASLFTDCTEVGLDGESLTVKRPVYSGKVYVEVVSQADLSMASIRPNVYAPASAGSGSAESIAVDAAIDDGMIKGKVREVISASSGGKDLIEAEIIVAGGRSLKNTENFGILEELAGVLGATVGASRAAVDAGYVPHSMQVGQTGKVVNPKLYIACGISGAIQHLVGMRTSKVIVSINKDENAPIFQKSDYGIVGDLFDVVPLLTREFKALLG